MFDLLKKKIGSFISGLTKKEGEETKQPPKEEPMKTTPLPVKEPAPVDLPPVVSKTITIEKANVKTVEQPKPTVTKNVVEKKPESVVEQKKPVQPVRGTIPKVKEAPEPKKTVEAERSPKVEKLPKEKEAPQPTVKVPKKEVEVPEDRISTESTAKPIEIAQGKGEKKVKQDLGGAIASFITGVVEIKEQDVIELLDTLELELLESDVSLEVADTIIQQLKSRLVGKKVNRGMVEKEIKGEITNTLVSIMEADTREIIEKLDKPHVTIMICGINGAGKTTTMAKLAHKFMAEGKKVCFAASDTFRAAAIEQLGIHATRLNVPIIKRPYGADPTAVAFDAVNYAKAHGINVVLIDTAGRQDTNTNLMNELKKMDRIIKPDVKIYVGESLAGNAIIEQVKTFKEEIGLDGVILTKIDCDPKGGTMLSIRAATGVPIVFVGTGQGYEDLQIFNAQEMVARILE